MSDLTYIVTLKDDGYKTFVMPTGFESNVEIHCWGAGGGSGWGGAPGGGGGYARTTVNINSGDEVTLQIGQPGRNAPSATGAGGAGGLDPTYQNFRGGNGGARGTWCGQVRGPYPSGGGGGASFVAIEGSFVCVAAGGGGGGGFGHNNFKDPGKPGGVYPGSASSIYAVTLSYAWNNFMNTYAVWGGGQDYTVTLNFPTTGTYTFNYAVDNFGSVYLDGNEIISYAGFTSTTTYTQTVSAGNHTVRVTGVNTGGPAGVAAQILKPDSSELWNTRALQITSGLTNDFRGGDAVWGGGGGGGYLGGASGFASGHTVTGGNGGLNYGGVTAAGSGTLPGGRTTVYYPTTPPNIGQAGYPGYIVMIFTRKPGLQIKNPDGSGDWVTIDNSYVKLPIQSVTVLQAVGAQTATYNSVGTRTFTVPTGVTSIQMTVIGGGGGGGGNDRLAGSPGRTGARVSGTLAVSPGQILTISVGSGGAGGTSDQGSAPGGGGGTNNLGYSGGRGSAAGPVPISGGGGGGGAASAILVNGAPAVVAAGGGGGGGGGNGGGGQGVSPGGTSGSIAGGAGTAKGGDGGGAGGGGGGHPQGGAGGNVGGGDVGGFSGADGQSLVPAGFSLGQGAAGGIEAIRGVRSSTGGGGGSITISYTPAPINVTVVTGGWKNIQQTYVKDGNVWKPITQKNEIVIYNYK